MNVDELQKSGRIIFEAVMGSRSYGLSTPQSDFDVRGIYVNPQEDYLGLKEPDGQIKTSKDEFVYYSLRRFFELATTANPNILEILWAPHDCIKICTPTARELIDNRKLFVSKKCYHTFNAYSVSQISKARGQNKMVNHPEMAVMPKKEDFCWVLPHLTKYETMSLMPARPLPLKEAESLFAIRLNEYHCSSLEHMANTYRLYYYGSQAKGVFRGDDMLVCESIPMEDEIPKFWGLLIYEQNEFEKALKEHQKYLDWKANRNEHRWIDQEKGLLQYDAKNMMHCVRLLQSGENVLRNGEPLVRFDGEQKEYLMRIRRGEIPYDTIMAEVESKMALLDDLYKTSSMPHSVNHKQIERLYRELTTWRRWIPSCFKELIC